MPEDPSFFKEVGWLPAKAERLDWSAEDLIEYNFQTPWVEGDRVVKLQALLASLAKGPKGEHDRTLAILTKNERGVVAVLNLLKIANIANYFSAIWTIPFRDAIPNGAYQEDGMWKCFDPPVEHVSDFL